MREHQAVRQRRMRIEPEGYERRWIGVRQIQLSENLKRVGGDFLRIRDQPMDDFQSVNVRSMFLHPAVPAVDRRRNEQQRLQEQEQHRKRSPVFLTVELPVTGPAIERPVQASKEEIERQQ